MTGGSWLCRDDMDRERLLDMDARIGPVRRLSMGIIALALAACGPWIGWGTLVPLAVAAVVFQVAQRRAPSAARPEYVLFAAWTVSELAIAGAVLMVGGAEVPTLSWLAIPVVTLSSRFSTRGVVLGVCVALALMLGIALGANEADVLDDPVLLIAPATLVITTAILSTALMRSDVHFRSETVIDPLTGMLNRKALATRVRELEQQSRLTGEPIGLIVGDLDRFKQVNDLCGHATGDAVLQQVAYDIRKELRAFDLAYRLGGEEFLVVLPGADGERAAELAERLRSVLAAGVFAEDQRVTMSFGVSASPRGAEFDYRAVFAEADAALLEAKRAGRDRVQTAHGPLPAGLVSA
jgi:diguanylate cyclase (GGDEF)-like protein